VAAFAYVGYDVFVVSFGCCVFLHFCAAFFAFNRLLHGLGYYASAVSLELHLYVSAAFGAVAEVALKVGFAERAPQICSSRLDDFEHLLLGFFSE
jgi:hypothetical protein